MARTKKSDEIKVGKMAYLPKSLNSKLEEKLFKQGKTFTVWLIESASKFTGENSQLYLADTNKRRV